MSIQYSKASLFLAILITWLITIPACDPCDGCGEPLFFDPNVKVTFINRDSLLSIRDSLTITTDSLGSISTKRDSLDEKRTLWNQLISQLRDSIADGKTQYIADTVRFDDSLKTVIPQIQLADTAIFRTNELVTFLTDIETVILSGSVRVNNLKILENQASRTFDDSSNTYNLPLLMQGFNITTFAIDIEDKKDTISFTYQTELFTDEERFVKMIAFDIDTVSYTYDSLIFECNTTECLSNEVFVTVYF